MEELTLVSHHQRPLKPLVEAALKNELRLVQTGIQRSQQKLHDFETRYDLSTSDFLRRFESDQLEETLEFAEWIGEFRLLTRLLEKSRVLQEVRFAD